MSNKNNCWCYIVSHEGLLSENIFKIGKSRNIMGRLRSLNTGTPFPFKLCCKIKSDMEDVEDKLHKHFSDRRVGGEFYQLYPNDFFEICDMYDDLAEFYPEEFSEYFSMCDDPVESYPENTLTAEPEIKRKNNLELKNRINTLENQNNSIKQNLEKTKQEKTNISTKNKELEEINKELRQDNIKFTQQMAELQQRVINLEKINEKLEQDNKRLLQRDLDVDNKVTLYQDQIISLQGRVSTLEQDNSTLYAHLEESKRYIDRLSNRSEYYKQEKEYYYDECRHFSGAYLAEIDKTLDLTEQNYGLVREVFWLNHKYEYDMAEIWSKKSILTKIINFLSPKLMSKIIWKSGI